MFIIEIAYRQTNTYFVNRLTKLFIQTVSYYVIICLYLFGPNYLTTEFEF
jgi:hypothetical protein